MKKWKRLKKTLPRIGWRKSLSSEFFLIKSSQRAKIWIRVDDFFFFHHINDFHIPDDGIVICIIFEFENRLESKKKKTGANEKDCDGEGKIRVFFKNDISNFVEYDFGVCELCQIHRPIQYFGAMLTHHRTEVQWGLTEMRDLQITGDWMSSDKISQRLG